MFEKFNGFVGLNNGIGFDSLEDFTLSTNGKTFLNGMYRFFKTAEIEKWCKIVEEAFPQYKNQISVFAFDWLGRIFALRRNTEKVLLFEPGTGEVLDIAVDIVAFHEEEIVDYNDDSLASSFFYEWFEANDNYILKHNECAGYKVPLFLNGDDALDNLEVSDMEVYWGIMTPLMNL